MIFDMESLAALNACGAAQRPASVRTAMNAGWRRGAGSSRCDNYTHNHTPQNRESFAASPSQTARRPVHARRQ